MKLKKIYFSFISKTIGRLGLNRFKIIKATFVVGFMTLAAKLISILKESAIASRFGTGDAMDAFTLSLTIATFFLLLISNSVHAAFIPTYLFVREREGVASSKRLFTTVYALVVISLIITTILAYIFLPYYLPALTRGFDGNKYILVKNLLMIFFPMIIIGGISAMWGAVLNAREHFGLVAISPVIRTIFVLMALKYFPRGDVATIALVTLAGMLTELLVIGYSLRKKGYELWPRFFGFDKNVKQIIWQFTPLFFGAAILSSSKIISQAMVTHFGSGSVAALNYGDRLVSFPITLATAALATAVIPYFSMIAAREGVERLNNFMKKIVFWTLMISIPFSLLFIAFSNPITRVLFERGSFTPQDTRLVSSIQAFYSLQIPFYIAGVLIARLLSTMLVNYILLIGNIISLVVLVIANVYFGNRYGVRGIALATSIMYMISFIYLFICWQLLYRKRLKKQHD